MTKLTEYTQTVLDRMVAEAVDDVWTGSLVKLVEETAPKSYYSLILRTLKAAGAIVQVRRGGGGSPSVWAITDPTPDLTDVTPRKGLERKRGLEGRVEVLERLVGGIDVAQALRDVLDSDRR